MFIIFSFKRTEGKSHFHTFISAHLRRHQILPRDHLSSSQKTPDPARHSSQRHKILTSAHLSSSQKTPDHPSLHSSSQKTPDHPTRSSHLISEGTRSSQAFISVRFRRRQILSHLYLSSSQKTHDPPRRSYQPFSEDTGSSHTFISAHLRRHKILPHVHLSTS